ncbi:serine/threonine-protein kinase [Catenuloplanes indicus]|uniref:WD40 repeat protein n=1 Tax=Catenuloplanes indicus TaxID=137267 RepID=A0AAE3W7X8_9ACTN|nr:serine/threonine-protein kinase [Catenuloplanes indicus]MDQ0371126.1 WD40 repeat protein [Catenuloplanes indicus]
MTWTRGQVVAGQYEVLDVLESGGMGLVHRVRHLGWQVDLAVKTPRDDHGHDLFREEAGTWVGLGLHPHVVNCVYVRTIDGMPRAFAEWVDGGSLAGQRGLAVPAILDLAVQIAWGLRHAHDAGLVHQDVKPANVMLAPDGTAKVTDFGLSRASTGGARRPGPPGSVTFGGGTPAYCSPEQAAAFHADTPVRLTRATDVWSWAVTLLEMFAGRPPTRYGQAAGAALPAFRQMMPPAVAGLLAECFADDPADRPDDLGDLAARLIAVYAEVAGRDYPRPVPRPALLRADGLSNQALSLYDLGRTREAEQLWREAVTADPHHLPSVYNLSLYRWRSGDMTGEEVVSAVAAARAAGDDERGAFLQGAIELERGGDAAALLRAASPAPEVTEALAEVERRSAQVRADVRTGGDRVTAVAVGPGGDPLLCGDVAGGLYLRSGTVIRKLGGGARVVRLAMDDAGRHAVSLREDGTIEFWDLSRGEREARRNLTGIVSVAISGDGRYAAIGSEQGLITVFEPAAQRQVCWLAGHTGPANLLALSRTGDQLLSASFGEDSGSRPDGTFRTWDVAAGELVEAWAGPLRGRHRNGLPIHTVPGDQAALSPAATFAVVAYADGPLRWFDVERGGGGDSPHPFRDGRTERSMVLSPDGERLLVAGWRGVPTRVFDPRRGTGGPVAELDDGLDYVWRAAISPDSTVAALGGDDGQVALRTLPDGGYSAPWCYARPRAAADLHRAEESFAGLRQRVHALIDDGSFAAAADALRSARDQPDYARHPEVFSAWRRLLAHGRRAQLLACWELWRLDGFGHLLQPPVVALRADGAAIAAPLWSGEVELREAGSARVAHTFSGTGGAAHELRWALGDTVVLALTRSGVLRRLHTGSGAEQVLSGEAGRITAFDLDQDGGRAVTGDDTGTLRLYDVRTGAALATARVRDRRLIAVALSPDGRFAAALDDTGRAMAWPFGAPGAAWTSGTDPGVPVDRDARLHFAADGRVLLLGDETTVTGRDTVTGAKLFQLEAMSGGFGTRIALSPDRRLGAVAGSSELTLFDAATGHVRHRLPVPDMPYAFALGPAGTFAVVSGLSHHVHVIDAPTGRLLRTLEGHTKTVHSIAVNADGTVLTTADLADELRVWQLAWEADCD